MRYSHFIYPALVLLTISLALADAPTSADLDQLFKQGDYAGVVKGCTDALAPGGISEPAERYKVAWLKGEAELRLKQADAAVDAFTAAGKETQDARRMAMANATAILIGRSKDFIYTSKTIKPGPRRPPPPPPPLTNLFAGDTPPSTKPVIPPPVILPAGQFDIIEPAHRTAAMAAMWTDERIDADATIKAQIALMTLPAVEVALDRIHQAEPIALAAGYADWAQSQKDKLANAARIDVNTAIRDMNTQLVAIVKEQVVRRSKPNPRPMPQNERDQLNSMTQALDKATETLKSLPERLNVEKDMFQPQLEHATTLEDRATTVLATD